MTPALALPLALAAWGAVSAAPPAAAPQPLQPLGAAVQAAAGPRLEAGLDLLVTDTFKARGGVLSTLERFGGSFSGQATAADAKPSSRNHLSFVFPPASLDEQLRRADRLGEELGRVGRVSLLAVSLVPADGAQPQAAWRRLEALRAERSRLAEALKAAPLTADLLDAEVVRLERTAPAQAGPVAMRFDVYLRRAEAKP